MVYIKDFIDFFPPDPKDFFVIAVFPHPLKMPREKAIDLIHCEKEWGVRFQWFGQFAPDSALSDRVKSCPSFEGLVSKLRGLYVTFLLKDSKSWVPIASTPQGLSVSWGFPKDHGSAISDESVWPACCFPSIYVNQLHLSLQYYVIFSFVCLPESSVFSFPFPSFW